MNQNRLDSSTPEFLSPPATPTIHYYHSFYEKRQEPSMKMPPSPPYFSNYYQPYYNKRKISKPQKSLSLHTKGSFHMPILPPITEPLAITNTIRTFPASTPLSTTTTLARNTKLPRIDIASMLNEEPSPAMIKPSNSTITQQAPAYEVVTPKEDVMVIKKSQTNAAALYDSLTAASDPEELLKDAKEWMPSYEVFNRRPVVRISWKGSPLKIKTMPYFEKLHPGEATIASTLRLTPEQYLKCKWALVLAAKEAHETNQLFRKSEAQKVCCIDVNKTSVLWHAFGKLGWLGKRWPQ